MLEGWIAKPSPDHAAINSITSNEVLNQIRSVFGNDIPCEILYNYHLAHITNPKVLIGDGYFDQLHKITWAQTTTVQAKVYAVGGV